MGDHDSLFKRAFSVPAHAAGEVRSVLPTSITERLDFSALKLVPASFVDAEMEHRHADLVFTVPLAGRPSYVYFLFEHQSEPERADASREISSLLGHLAAWGAELERLVREDPDREDVLVVLRYILRVAGETPYETLRQHIAEVAPTCEESMASVEQQLIEQGIQKGIEQGIEKGIEQGIEQGIQRTLVRLLRARFGDLDPAKERRIAHASADVLDRWIERVLVAQRIDDVFDDD